MSRVPNTHSFDSIVNGERKVKKSIALTLGSAETQIKFYHYQREIGSRYLAHRVVRTCKEGNSPVNNSNNTHHSA